MVSTKQNKPPRHTSQRHLLAGLALATTTLLPSLGLAGAPAPAALAASTCQPLPTSQGTVTTTVNFPSSGAYRVWVRMLAPTTTPAGLYLQLADANACQVTVGRAALPANQLTWLDYQNGSSASTINVTVAAGSHQVVLAGLDSGVEVDRVIFLTDTNCVPTGDGSNCTTTTPTVTPTSMPTATPTRTPAPTPPLGDTQPPSVPANLTSTGQTDSSIALSWSASSDNVAVTGYHVMRNGSQVATVTGTTYIDTGLTPTTAYSYTVSAFDAARNQSVASAPLTVSTLAGLDTTPPTAPTSLAARANSPTSVALTWNAATDNVGVAGYYVQRGGVTLAQTTGTIYTDTTAVAGTGYSYVIKAFDAAGNVGPGSATATVTTPNPDDTTPPTAPTGLTATVVSAGQANLSWNAATDNVGVAGYRISRGGQLLAQVQASATSYGDTTVAASTVYSYTVSAFDAAGNVGPTSATATVTTPPATTVSAGGLQGIYYDNANFTGKSLSRLDPTINFNWSLGAPISGIGADTFSVRWIGQIFAPTTGKYTFYTRSDDGIRLWVNGQLVVNNWSLHAVRQNQGSITLSGGRVYNLKVEYFDNLQEAVAELFWKGPQVNKQVVPSNVLYHAN